MSKERFTNTWANTLIRVAVHISKIQEMEATCYHQRKGEKSNRHMNYNLSCKRKNLIAAQTVEVTSVHLM